MHGFIHMTLRSLVLSKPQGEAKWAQLLVKIGAIEITFLELRMHPDELTVASVVAAAELLGTDVPGALLAFGHHFVVFSARPTRVSPRARPARRPAHPTPPPPFPLRSGRDELSVHCPLVWQGPARLLAQR